MGNEADEDDVSPEVPDGYSADDDNTPPNENPLVVYPLSNSESEIDFLGNESEGQVSSDAESEAEIVDAGSQTQIVFNENPSESDTDAHSECDLASEEVRSLFHYDASIKT